MNVILDNLKKEFTKQYNNTDVRNFFAPGRVNLIGEHTDYNGGHVFPCALSFGTYATVSKRDDENVRLYSMNFEDLGVIKFSLNDLVYKERDNWANYPKGVIKTFIDNGYTIDKGFDCVFYGNIPNGAGLSSSASIELAISVILKGLFNLDIDMINMVKLSQKAENEFVGVNCGIMDQFAIGMGKADQAILLDANTLGYRYLPLNLEGISIVIANTNKQRKLGESKYNERRKECETALADLQTELKISALGELDEKTFNANIHLIKDDIHVNRAKHAIYENQRTLKACAALELRDISLFGSLMNESHKSLRDDYEVTGLELDALVQAAWDNGAIGSRMTGAGFGGCTVSLVKSECLESFIINVGNAYKNKIGYDASFYVASIGDGAKEII